MPVESGAAGLANTLALTLIGDANFVLPVIGGDGSGEVNKLTNSDLTTGVDGDGIFDAIMKSISSQLDREYRNNRITGAEYTKAYIGSVTAALSAAVQYLLGRDQSFWQAVLLQRNAYTASVEYALTKMKLAGEDINYLNGSTQIAQIEAQTALINSQKTGVDFNNTQILPAQKKLTDEQVEVQRAQTMNNRTDGSVITGAIGKQKDLYSQQITSYQRDAETKVAKLFTDAWITQKTIDEGLIAPNGFTNSSLDIILSKLKANNALT